MDGGRYRNVVSAKKDGKGEEEEVIALKKYLMYHGSPAPFTRFSYQFVGQGHDEQGPGFYLTSDIMDARRYGPHVMQVEARIRKLVPTGRANPAHVRSLIKMAPDLDDTLTNWGENPARAFNTAYSAMIRSGNARKVFEQVWWDFYQYHTAEYLKNMVKLGYDGVLIPREADYRGRGAEIYWLVAFDPAKLTVLNTVYHPQAKIR